MLKKILVLAGLAAAMIATAQAQTKVVAHRGYWRTEGSAQNSLASFIKADAAGVYGSEIDVWLTADDKLVVNHDRKFKGVEMETSDLKTATAIVLDNGEKLPTLDEYLKVVKQYPNTRLVLEMKSLKDLSRERLAAGMIVKKLKKYGLVAQTDIIAFSLNACMEFARLLPDTKVYYLNGDLSPKQVKRIGLAGVDYQDKVIKAHPDWVKQAHDLGLEVNVWTVDKPEDMKYFIDLGVDYITTNEPVVLNGLLKK